LNLSWEWEQGPPVVAVVAGAEPLEGANVMRAILFAAVIAASSVPALAGPSDHQSRRFGDYSAAERPELNRRDRQRNAPYALTGERAQRRVVKFRDVPTGRGQTESVPYWQWVSE
jgi:hypothetical protein